MKKTISLTLGGRVYVAEEEAFILLDSYLTRLKTRFASDPSVDELLSDIEASISEKLFEKTHQAKNAIREEDAKEVLAIMGRVEEIDETPTPEATPTDDTSEPTLKKHFYRNEDDQVIAGVCAGIAAYFHVDPLFIRLAFIILAFINGLGVFAYVVLWATIPLAKTSTQKLAMRGKAANLEELEEYVKERASIVKTEGKAAFKRLQEPGAGVLRKILSIPVIIIGSIWTGVRWIWQTLKPILRVAIGFTILMGSAIGMVLVSALASALLFQHSLPAFVTDLPITGLTDSRWYTLSVIAFALTALISLFFSLLVGMTVLTQKNHFRPLVIGLLLGSWIITGSISLAGALHVIPTIQAQAEREIQEQTITRTYPLGDIRKIVLAGRGQFTIKQGDSASLQLIGFRTSLDHVSVTGTTDTLTIQDPLQVKTLCLFCVHPTLQGEIILPHLNDLQVGRLSHVTLSGFSDDLQLSANDAAKIEAHFIGQNVTTTLEDLATLDLSGRLQTFVLRGQDATRVIADDFVAERIDLQARDLARIQLSGMGHELILDVQDLSRLDARTFRSDTVSITTKDTSRAYLQASQHLEASAYDLSRIFYTAPNASTTLRTYDSARIRNSSDPSIPSTETVSSSYLEIDDAQPSQP